MRTAIVTLLVVSLGAGSMQAQQPAFSFRRAAREEAARQASSATTTPRTQMRPGLKWAGIGLLSGGGVLLLQGVLADAPACPDDRAGYEVHCFEHAMKLVAVATGGAGVATGVLLLLIGHATRKPVPSVNFAGDRVTLRIRF